MTERITDRIEIVNADCYTLLDGWPSDAALVTDPPYGIGIVRGGKIGGTSRDVKRWSGQINTPAHPIHGDDRMFDPDPFLRFATVCLWGANHYASRLPDSPCWLVWYKRVNGQENKFADCELAWTNRDAPARCVQHLWMGMLRDSEMREHWHPTQKPVRVCAWCLRTLALPSDTLVIDPFMGSGSIGVACHRAGLRYLGVEIDPEHYATARARLLRETAQGLLMPNDTAHRQDRSASGGPVR
jgi:site-specific DNA-methyltransferase (adenine-specific)/modification methylase